MIRIEEHFVETEGLYPYAISNYGTVVNVETNREMKQTIDAQGYSRVTIRRNTPDGVKKYTLYIHRWVAMAFFLYYENGIEVLHINENKQDNSILNLTLGGPCRKAEVDVREADEGRTS